MTKDRLSAGEIHKFSQSKIGPCEEVHMINDNAYKLKLPKHIRTFDVFNVKHLLPCHGDTFDNKLPNLMANSFEERGTDAAQNIALNYLDKRAKPKVYKKN
ncbi:hypothetical protein AMTRI_Chr07g28060 [Amborella trichopoda]